MEEMQGSKRKRVYSIEPSSILRATFSQKYINHLLSALLKISTDSSRDNNESQEIEKIVRFQVDMALVMSADEFRWSHALKRKLQTGMNKTPPSPTLLFTYKHIPHCYSGENLKDFPPSPPLPRTLVPVGYHRNSNPNPNSQNSSKRPNGVYQNHQSKKRRTRDEDGELVCRLSTLRRILPGGDEMGAGELLSEVKSYIICLELQVSILRTLVNAH
ncbi:transcription factor bHLH146 [Magnolia sinica]|uniref:transcription factor bHLH146 n=1 Tax=Magnolia sinica TaxID=86752 RepID=UPI00265A2943|nr:transcription factor bHLH146 [Magnolia sinica]